MINCFLFCFFAFLVRVRVTNSSTVKPKHFCLSFLLLSCGSTLIGSSSTLHDLIFRSHLQCSSMPEHLKMAVGPSLCPPRVQRMRLPLLKYNCCKRIIILGQLYQQLNECLTVLRHFGICHQSDLKVQCVNVLRKYGIYGRTLDSGFHI